MATLESSATATTDLYVGQKRAQAPTLRRVWTLPATLAYARGHKIDTSLYLLLGLADDANDLTLVKVGNVTYAVEAGPGLQPPVE